MSKLEALANYRLTEFRKPPHSMAVPAAPRVAAAPGRHRPSETFIVYFDWDSDAVDRSGDRVIDEAVTAANSLGIADFSITGHADRSGSDDYNLNLSLRRADNVKAALIARGVDEAGISVAGRGEAEPAIESLRQLSGSATPLSRSSDYFTPQCAREACCSFRLWLKLLKKSFEGLGQS